MELTIDEIAHLVGGTVIGDGSVTCRGANPPAVAATDDITLLVDADNVDATTATGAKAVVTATPIASTSMIQVIVADPHKAFAQIVSRFRPPADQTLPGVGVHSSAEIATSAKVHPTATICAGVSIGERTLVMPGVVIMPGCKIGSDCVLFPSVVLYEHTQLADRILIHSGAVIGAYGFGYRQEGGKHLPTSQLGYVKIASDVEIGAGTTIDRGTYGPTTIGEGTKIDNQVMIAHNCQIGRHNLICAQVGIAGSSSTGDHVILAGQVGLKDHIKIGDRAVVAAKSGLMHDVEPGQYMQGIPAIKMRDFMQCFAIQRKLPDMRREMRKLRKELDALTEQLSEAEGGNDGTSQSNQAA